MADYYNAPGAAATDGMNQYLIQQAALKRQDLLDRIATAREDRQAKEQEQEMQLRRDELNERRIERMALIHERENKDKEAAVEKQKAAHEKTLSNMVPGDIMTPDMSKNDVAFTGGQMSTDPKQGLKNFMATLPAGSPEQLGVQAQTVGPRIFMGNRVDRENAAAKEHLDNYILRLPPNSVARKVAEAKREGVTLTAADLKLDNPATTENEHLYSYNPISGKYTDTETGQVVSSVPKGSIIQRMAEPKDHTASDNANKDRDQRTLLGIQEHAYTELNKRAAPIEEQINNLNKLDTSLAQNSNIADSTIAEQVIKITAGGTGSGVRITQPEIDQVLKRTRTKWADLEVAFNKWGGDPNAPLILNTDQKQGLRELMKAIRLKANNLHKKIITARHEIDDAKTPDEVKAARTRSEEALYAGGSDSGGAGGKDIEYDMNGKVISGR
jgi:hypothetical protein